MLIIPDRTYSNDLINVTKQLASSYSIICYVSLNKPYNSLMKNFEDNNIDKNKFFIIDATSKPFKQIQESENCIFISSISAIGELNIAVAKVLKKGKFEALIFDSLSTMLIYHDAGTVTKFIQNLIREIRMVNCTAVFTCLEGDSQTSLIKEMGMFIDRVIEMKVKKLSAIEYQSMKKELTELIEHLFGSETSKLIGEYSEGKDPELLLSQWKEMMAKIIGQANAEKQLESIKQKYM